MRRKFLIAFLFVFLVNLPCLAFDDHPIVFYSPLLPGTYGIFDGDTSSDITVDDGTTPNDFSSATEDNLGPWTYDFWVNFKSLNTINTFWSWSQGGGWWQILYAEEWGAAENKLIWRHWQGASSPVFFHCPWVPVVDTWYHIAIVRSGTGLEGEWFAFINGVSVTVSKGGVAPWDFACPIDNNGEPIVGKREDTEAENFVGWMDNFRYSWGARWTSNFTPGTYPDVELDMSVDANTKFLLKYSSDVTDETGIHEQTNDGVTFNESGGAIIKFWDSYFSPATNQGIDIGSSALEFNDLYVGNMAYINSLDLERLGDDLDVDGYDFHSMGSLYGVDNNIGIDMGTDGEITASADSLIYINSPEVIVSNNLTVGATTDTLTLSVGADSVIASMDTISINFGKPVLLTGDAKAWRLQDLKPANIGLPTTNPPGEDDYLGFTFQRFDDGPTEEQVFYTWHVPNDFSEGDASVRGYFGFMVDNPPGAGSVTVKLGFQYKKKGDGEIVEFGTPSGDVLTEIIDDAEAAYTWHQTDTGVCTTTGWERGDIILFRFYRDATSDNYVGDAWVGIYHLEYLTDRFGENN